MATRLDKTLKRELEVEGKLYTVTISPEGVKIVPKGARKGPEITSQQIGLEVLANLQRLDQVAYVRFASVYKDFQEIGDFQREVGLMLQKKESKARSR